MSCHTAMVCCRVGSFFTREYAISTRKPSQPRPSQNRITSSIAFRVAIGPGASTGCCQLAVQVAAKQAQNDALQDSIDRGGSLEEMLRIAREELGLVAPNEKVFYDTSN